jgi:hypothetical protein
MTGVLIVFNMTSVVFLVWVLIGGYSIEEMRMHITLALAATALSVFSHSLTMMYFAAVGRMIREAVEKAHLRQDYVVRTKQYRSKIFRLASLAMLLVMANTILAGGTHTKMFSAEFHHWFSIITLAFNTYVVYLEIRYLIENHLLGHRVAREFERRNA